MTIETVVESRKAAWLALILGVIGIATHPDILNVLPSHWSGIITGAAVILQGITRSLLGGK